MVVKKTLWKKKFILGSGRNIYLLEIGYCKNELFTTK